ncbi:MAG: hypothetical protein AAFZ65_10755 [Planctomycetota bacterium]
MKSLERAAWPVALTLTCLGLLGCQTILRATPQEERASLTLTFDDRPNPPVTEALLDRLAEADVRAYFSFDRRERGRQ